MTAQIFSYIGVNKRAVTCNVCKTPLKSGEAVRVRVINGVFNWSRFYCETHARDIQRAEESKAAASDDLDAIHGMLDSDTGLGRWSLSATTAMSSITSVVYGSGARAAKMAAELRERIAGMETITLAAVYEALTDVQHPDDRDYADQPRRSDFMGV